MKPEIYAYTACMLAIAIMFAILMAWISKRLSEQNKYIISVDNRCAAIETLVKNEFQDLIKIIKKKV